MDTIEPAFLTGPLPLSSHIMFSIRNACQIVATVCLTPRSSGAGTPVAALSTHFPSSHSYGYAS